MDVQSGGATAEADRRGTEGLQIAQLSSRHPFFFQGVNMIHRALRLLRSYHGMKQTELAKRLGISNSYLSEIESESSEKTPSLELLTKYAEVFKIPVSSILLFSETMEQGPSAADKIRRAAADKILRVLEWAEERDAIKSGQEEDISHH
jgi:transcriptional regulator with XRE-family HTH domain